MQIETVHISAHSKLQNFLTRFKVNCLSGFLQLIADSYPDSKIHGTNMGPIWGRQGPGGPMLGPWTLLSG